MTSCGIGIYRILQSHESGMSASISRLETSFSGPHRFVIFIANYLLFGIFEVGMQKLPICP